MSVKKVIVALSGGVDSAVSALLLKKKGYHVQGVFMRNWDLADESDTCSINTDMEDAEFICKNVGIPFQTVSFVKEYWNEVFTYMLNSYENGFVPNPDIMCNKKIKFDVFFNYAMDELRGDALATGHYARTTFGCYLERYEPSKDVALLKAVDNVKDQTFFLSQIPQESLRRTMFPIGDLTKAEVRQIAVENGLQRIARKKESMGICFIGSRNFKKFINNYIRPKPGKFIDISTGRVEGDHDGIHLWILGQRVNIPGQDEAKYAVAKCGESDILVGGGANHPALLSRMVITSKPHWIARSPEMDMFLDCDFQFQHINNPVKCRIIPLSGGSLFVTLEKPLTQMNPGQFAVFYKGEECLGSAEIFKVGPTYFSLGKTVPPDFRE